MSVSARVRLVLMPDALGRAIVDPRAAGVLLEWREGRIQPVVTRSLAVRYLRVLHRLGLADRTLRWWGWWFGSPSKVHLVAEEPPETDLDALCFSLARQAGAEWIVHGRTSEAETAAADLAAVPPRWVAVHQFRTGSPTLRPPGPSGA